jgi:hypothetical protein
MMQQLLEDLRQVRETIPAEPEDRSSSVQIGIPEVNPQLFHSFTRLKEQQQLQEENEIEKEPLASLDTNRPRVFKGEQYYLATLLNEINDNIKYFMNLGKALHQLGDRAEEKVKYVDKRRNRIDAIVNELKIEQKMLNQLIAESPEVKKSNALIRYLTACSDQITRALRWIVTSEDQLIEQFILHVTENERQNQPLESKIFELERKAEKLAVKSIPAFNSPEQRRRYSEKFTTLQNRIAKEIKLLEESVYRDGQTLSFINRLYRVQDYMKNNISSLVIDSNSNNGVRLD